MIKAIICQGLRSKKTVFLLWSTETTNNARGNLASLGVYYLIYLLCGWLARQALPEPCYTGVSGFWAGFYGCRSQCGPRTGEQVSRHTSSCTTGQLHISPCFRLPQRRRGVGPAGSQQTGYKTGQFRSLPIKTVFVQKMENNNIQHSFPFVFLKTSQSLVLGG